MDCYSLDPPFRRVSDEDAIRMLAGGRIDFALDYFHMEKIKMEIALCPWFFGFLYIQ